MKSKVSTKKEIKKTPALQPLPLTKLRRVCDLDQLKFKSTEELGELKEIIGQDRALHALTFGLEIRDHGFHIFALGQSGTGKAANIRKYLEKEAKNKPNSCRLVIC